MQREAGTVAFQEPNRKGREERDNLRGRVLIAQRTADGPVGVKAGGGSCPCHCTRVGPPVLIPERQPEHPLNSSPLGSQ